MICGISTSSFQRNLAEFLTAHQRLKRPKHLVKKGFFLQTLISMLRFIFFCLLAVLAFFCPCCLASFCVFSVSVVLTAAVTQASLQSMLHKILTAGPSAFNITTLLSQATQLSSQGTYTHRSICLVLPFTFKPAVFYSCYNAIQIMSWLIWF